MEKQSSTPQIKVTFPGEEPICGATNGKTFAAVIERIGLDKVASLNIQHDGQPLLGRGEFQKRPFNPVKIGDNKEWTYQAGLKPDTAVELLKHISESLGIGLMIEIE